MQASYLFNTCTISILPSIVTKKHISKNQEGISMLKKLLITLLLITPALHATQRHNKKHQEAAHSLLDLQNNANPDHNAAQKLLEMSQEEELDYPDEDYDDVIEIDTTEYDDSEADEDEIEAYDTSYVFKANKNAKK